jgi:carbon monoxide dehydrogenase subunit G
MDPKTIVACLPGCQKCETITGDRYEVVLTAGIAAITGSFVGTVTVADKNPPFSYRLIIDGRGAPGFARGESTITLRSLNGSVEVDVVGVVHFGGLIAQVGQRLLGATARLLMDRFFKCLQSRLANRALSG